MVTNVEHIFFFDLMFLVTVTDFEAADAEYLWLKQFSGYFPGICFHILAKLWIEPHNVEAYKIDELTKIL